MHASLRQHADTARLASELAGAAAAAGSRADVALDALDAALGASTACARQLAMINSTVDDIAALGDTLALSAALEAARGGLPWPDIRGRGRHEVRTLAQRAAGAARVAPVDRGGAARGPCSAPRSARLRPGMQAAAMRLAPRVRTQSGNG
ncbi:hypothetical protein LP419_37105 [Massilia sp. H-1]|nr:hypothetical protein LP419_37105 [Massilia sp. H-1]